MPTAWHNIAPVDASEPSLLQGCGQEVGPRQQRLHVPLAKIPPQVSRSDRCSGALLNCRPVSAQNIRQSSTTMCMESGREGGMARIANMPL